MKKPPTPPRNGPTIFALILVLAAMGAVAYFAFIDTGTTNEVQKAVPVASPTPESTLRPEATPTPEPSLSDVPITH